MLEVRIRKNLPGFNLDVAFAVNQEILAVIGPSGSGKTMTMLCIAGLIPPDEGYIKLNSKVLYDSDSDINLPPQQRRVGFVFQNYALFPHLTVRDNIAFGIRHLSRQDVEEKVGQLLDKMHIQELGHRYPRQLSAGQQQRVALGRALAPEPDVLLMDEPFSALDTHVKERLERELLNLQQFYQGNILFVTHDLSEGYKLSSKIAVYESGRILQCESKQQVIAAPANRTVARLTGVRNLIAGSVAEIEGSSVWVAVPGLGGRLRVAARDAAQPAIGQQVTVGIRAEYVQVADHPDENTFPGKVSQAVEGVSSINYCFRLQGDTAAGYDLEASLSKSEAPPISSGQSCYLRLPPDRLCIIRD